SSLLPCRLPFARTSALFPYTTLFRSMSAPRRRSSSAMSFRRTFAGWAPSRGFVDDATGEVRTGHLSLRRVWPRSSHSGTEVSPPGKSPCRGLCHCSYCNPFRSAPHQPLKAHSSRRVRGRFAVFERIFDTMADALDEGPFFHGPRAELAPGDLLTAGFASNYRPEVTMNHIYFTALPDGAGLAAEVAALNGGQPHVYEVEPLGDYDDDPNVTDKKFPGNPTRSFRSTEPLRIVREVTD